MQVGISAAAGVHSRPAEHVTENLGGISEITSQIPNDENCKINLRFVGVCGDPRFVVALERDFLVDLILLLEIALSSCITGSGQVTGSAGGV